MNTLFPSLTEIRSLRAEHKANTKSFSEMAKELKHTLAETRRLLVRARTLHADMINSDPFFPSIPRSKLVQAKELFSKHNGSRQEMITRFMNELNMSEAGAKTYASKVMSKVA